MNQASPRAPRSGASWAETVLTLVGSGSVDSLTVSGFCEEAQISRPTFYSRFGNLEGLLAEVWFQRGQGWLNSLVSNDFTTNTGSQSLAHILAVTRRKPELAEVVEPVVQRWWRDVTNNNDETCVAWLVANRLGVLLTQPVDPAVAVILELDAVIQRLLDNNWAATGAASEILQPLSLAKPLTDDVVFNAAISVIAAAGYSGASMSRIARYVQMTTGAIYPHFSTTSKLLDSAFHAAQRIIVQENEKLWQTSKFTVRNFGQFIAGGLTETRADWRHVRLETFLAAPSNSTVRDSAFEAIADSADLLREVIAATTLPDQFKPIVHYLFHTLGLGFGVLSDVGLDVARLHHVELAEQLGAELNL